MKYYCFLKNFLILWVLLFIFAACKSSGTSSKKQKNENLNTQNHPPSFDELINTHVDTHFFFDESLGAELAQPSEIPGALFTATDPDSSNILTYKLVGVEGYPGDHTYFTVDSSSGQIFKNNKNYDHETKDSYTFAVEVSDNTSSPQVDQIQVTLIVIDLDEIPLAPKEVTISPGDNKLVVDWEAPYNTGRPEITDYTIYWDTTSGGTSNKRIISGVSTTHVITGLNNGSTYYVHVRAKNADGLGEASLIASGSPSSGNSQPVIQPVSNKQITNSKTTSVTVRVLDADEGENITLTAQSGTPEAITVSNQIPTQTIVNGFADFTFDLTAVGVTGASSTITLVAQDNSGDRTTDTSSEATFDVDVVSIPFISVWRVPRNDKSITLPLRQGFNYNFIVDWGDGSSSEITSYDDMDRTHSYTSSGDYTLAISGLVEAWHFNGKGDKDKIISVTDLGDTGWKSLNAAFKECRNLSDFSGGEVSSVTDMSAMFALATATNPDVSDWDVSRVTNMASMFSSATSATPDVSDWDVSNVTNMNHIFYYAASANPDVSRWNVSNVTNMHGMFFRADSANPDVSDWDVSKVTNMTTMFFKAASATPNMSQWNLNSVIYMDKMFYGLNLSTEDYSNLLIQIQDTSTQHNVSLHAGGSKYNYSASSAREALIHRGWRITDGGLE